MGCCGGKKMNNNNKLTLINEVLYQELDRLNNDSYMNDDFDKKLKRSAALQKAALTMVRISETNIKVLDAAERNATSVERMNDFLGLNSPKKNDK